MLQNQNTVDTAASRARLTYTTHTTYEGSRGNKQRRALVDPMAVSNSDVFSLLSEGQVRLLVVPATSRCSPYLMRLPPSESPKHYSKSAKYKQNLKITYTHILNNHLKFGGRELPGHYQPVPGPDSHPPTLTGGFP